MTSPVPDRDRNRLEDLLEFTDRILRLEDRNEEGEEIR